MSYIGKVQMSSSIFLLKNIQKFHDLEKIVTARDHVVLLGDSLLLDKTQLDSLKTKNLYMLEAELVLVAETSPNILNVINYDEFASLLLEHTQCISLS